MTKRNLKEIERAIILGIRDYFRKNNVKKAIIGISGGLDSAVTCFLAVKALGKENIIGVLLPDSVTSRESSEDAKKVVTQLKIQKYIVPIDSFIQQLKDLSNKNKMNDDLFSFANAKARIRMTILYFFAQQSSALVLGTSDKSEIALGYTTKYGDGASDFLPIGDLWKTEVFELGKLIGIPASILKKKPSAELIKGMDAEKELGAPYTTLDSILRLHIEDQLSAQQIVANGFEPAIVATVFRRLINNEHKRKMPPIIRLSERSFHSTEWRMPTTNRFG